jgi:hypothetical protein
MVGHDMLPAKDLPAYICAMTKLEQEDFTECYCGG